MTVRAYTIEQIAAALGKAATTVRDRATLGRKDRKGAQIEAPWVPCGRVEGSKAKRYAFDALPQAVREAIDAHEAREQAAEARRQRAALLRESRQQLAAPKPEGGAVVPASAGTLAATTPDVLVKRGQTKKALAASEQTDAQRAYVDAALVLCAAIEEVMAERGKDAVKPASRVLAARIVAGEASDELVVASATTYLKPRNGNTAPKDPAKALAARLERIYGHYLEGQKVGDPARFLSPGKGGPGGHKPADVLAFLTHYCLPSRPTVIEAWRKSAEWYAERGFERPAKDTWYRIEKSLPVTVKYRGRMTGSAWRSIKPYIERDVSMFKSNDIWVGDGHSFKAKVQHPIHGKPFTPEVTVIMDWVSRKIVGWSASLAESTIAVSDAFRHAQQVTRARPLVYYSDNGSGQTGKMLDCQVSGTLVRQGIAHETGIPGNPQARGIIERLWQVTLIPLAREYPTCTWRGADENTTTKMLKTLNRKDQGEVRIPSWRQFLDDVARVVDEYNLNHEHGSLNGRTPEDEYQARLDPGSIVFGPSDGELSSLWMPEVVRVPQRGRVSLFGNSYCKAELVDLLAEGEQVRVRYDLHDASHVWLFTLKGEFLGVADWDSHKEAAFPVAEMDRKRAERASGKTRRGEQIIDEAQAEKDDVIDLPPVAEKVPAPDFAMQFFGDDDEAVIRPTEPLASSQEVTAMPARQYDDMTDVAMYLHGDQVWSGDDSNKADDDSDEAAGA